MSATKALEIAEKFPNELVDLRPYMIEKPYTVTTKDKLYKILDIFRFMHLRHLPVIKESTGTLEGIITRSDIFSYMSL